MTRKTVKLLFALVAGFVLLVPIARAQVTDTNIKIRQYTLALSAGQPGQDPNQAGGNPNVEIFMRFCHPGLAVTNVTHANPADPTTPFRVTVDQPHGIAPPPSVDTIVRVVNTGVAGADGMWQASAVDATTFQLDSRAGVASGDMKFSPGARAQISPDFGCIGGAAAHQG